MDMLQQQGGVMDDGMNMDPVSGNPVPPGSLASEVRDDIPAQLSEGEYVVPADVLRYFGVAFFEDLRAQAKEGLAQMDADGRIGGEPVPMEGEDTLPFSPEELQVIGGGEDMQMAAMGMAQGGMTRGYQEGGTVTAPNFMEQFVQRFQSPGGTYFEPQQPVAATPATGETDTRMYVNDRGNMIAITFIDGVPQQEIPEGFRPLGETAAPEVSPIGDGAGGAMWSDGMTAAEIRDAQARGDFTPKGQTPSKSFADYTAEDWAGWSPSMGQRVGDIAGAVLNFAVPGIAGAALGAGASALGRNVTLGGYTALNDFISTLDINDPAYSELTDKRNELYTELVDANNKTGGGLGNWFRETFNLQRPEIPAPTSGVTTTTPTRGTTPSRTTTPTTPSAPTTPTRPAAGIGSTPVSFSGSGGSDSSWSEGLSASEISAQQSSWSGTTGAGTGIGGGGVGMGSAGVSFGGSATGGGTASSGTGAASTGGGGLSMGEVGGHTGATGGFSMGESVGGGGATGGQPTVQNRGGLMGRSKNAPRKRGRAARKSKK
jgi:hypothetical protein